MEARASKCPIPPTGNTNTHGKFQPDVRTFLKRWVQEGPTHHFALGIGHKAAVIQKIADCLGIECVITQARSFRGEDAPGLPAAMPRICAV